MKISILFLFLSISSTSLSVKIECKFTTIIQYTCQTVKITSVEERKLEIEGLHEIGKTNDDVAAFSFMNGAQDLTFIPENINEIFPNLLTLHIVGTKISQISSDDLKDLSSLQAFHAMTVPIMSLPGDLFFYNRNLRDVRFYGSDQRVNLHQIGENLLGELTKLENAEFRFNFCINRVADNQADIKALNAELHVLCPPPETTTYDYYIPTSTELYYCPSACSQRFDDLERRINELESRMGINSEFQGETTTQT